MPVQPPYVNGVADLTADAVTALYGKLVAIRDGFVASDDQPVCDTFYIVSTFNKANKGKEINGDTAEYVLEVGGADVGQAG